MTALEQLHNEIDQSDWDITNYDQINKAFQLTNDILDKEDNKIDLHFSEVERQAFAFSKTPEKKLSFRMAGQKTLQDGTNIPFEWPDLSTFTPEDFDYLIKRFKEAKNTFAQAEYGLVLYYSGLLKKNEDVKLLLQKLLSLSKSYLDKLNPDTERNYYILYFEGTLANALHIAQNRRSDTFIKAIYDELIILVFSTHQHWDVTHKASLRTIIDFTEFAIQYFKDFNEIVEIVNFLQKNWEAVEYISKTYSWGAIYIADVSIRLCKKLGISVEDWMFFKAMQFEKLAKESKEQNNNMAAVAFIEKAMAIYKDLKSESNLSRLQAIYQEVRGDFRLDEMRHEVPKEEVQRISQNIIQAVQNNSEEDIVKILLFTPMIASLEDIKKSNERSMKNFSFEDILPVSIQDKFGNTIETFYTDEEREEFKLLRTYEFHLQIAVQTIVQFFIEALRASKISKDSIIGFLKKTWIGQSKFRKVNGNDTSIDYLALIEPNLKYLFYELQQWKTVQGYLPNFVSVTDSLILKLEYFIREFTSNIRIPTFKSKPKTSGVIMEKTLDDLLFDLKPHLSEDDWYFIKFILTEKAGYNLRNRIAHGLMDNVDYGFELPILALIILLKLSNYQFIQQKDNDAK